LSQVNSKNAQDGSKTKELKSKLSQISSKSTQDASEAKELKGKLSQVNNKNAQDASKMKGLKSKLSQISSKSAHAASENKELKSKVSALEGQLNADTAKAAAKSAEQEISITECKAKLKVRADPKQSTSSTEQAAGSDFDGCRLVQNQVDTAQSGFALKSVLKPTNMLIMGADVANRTCVLRGVVKFTSIGSTAVAFFDPNYRDPTTRMPFCFPMATMIFLASVTDPNGQQIARTVALQIEPHGRMVIIGKEPKDVSVRLDNIMYHPLMEFNTSPQSCAPYCFPAGNRGENEMPMAGCIKYCTPTQYVRQKDATLKLNKCKCTMMKRLDCYKHVSKDPEVLSGVKTSPTICGQFKKLMEVSNPKKCQQICAGQLVSF